METTKNQIQQRPEICSISCVRKVAAMLDLDPNQWQEGAPLPRGWHFFLLSADTRKSILREDGFPGLGIALPDLGLPRLMISSRSVTYYRDLDIGSRLRRISRVVKIEEKQRATGRLALVTVEHELWIEPQDLRQEQGQDLQQDLLALRETQTYILLPAKTHELARTPTGAGQIDAKHLPVSGVHHATFIPDETLLFQYSALGFNAHKIHLDKTYARDVEGYLELVVNGGLSTLLLTELFRTQVAASIQSAKIRYLAPLFCNHRMRLSVAFLEGQTWQLQSFDHLGQLAVDMEIITNVI